MTTACERCKGTGFIPVTPDLSKECICAYSRRVEKHLGLELASAANHPNGPLYQYEAGVVTVDRTRDNLMLSGAWEAILPHLKWCFLCKGLGFRFLEVTDERIKSVWLGSEAYHKKQAKKREDGDTYNGLRDLLEPPDLVLLRLGFLGYANVAMPGVLKESLLLRYAQKKPTWLVEDPTIAPFAPGHHAYSDDVGTYIAQHFQTVTFKAARTTPTEITLSEASAKVFDRPLPQSPQRKPKAQPTEDLADMSQFGGGSKKRKWK